MESEAAVSNEAELDFIIPLEFNTYLTEEG